MARDQLLLTFYGDDNTGSTDAMEALARNGVNTVLFLKPPEPEALARFPGAQAVGVAGMTRTLAPTAMEAELRPAFTKLQALGARVCHYKVCSTFDSSPQVGSIGRGLDVGAEVFGTATVPLVVGAPVLRRYTLFGNLFATVGDETFRIDRHPTMSRHPVTPMDEGDLRVHLGKQTGKRIALVDILHLSGSRAEIDARFAALLATRPGVALFDVLDDARLAEAGRLIWNLSERQPLFTVGSSGLEYALVPELRARGLIAATPPALPRVQPAGRMLVISGSCSPVTSGQLDHVLDELPDGQRFAGIDVDGAALLDPDRGASARQAAIGAGIAALGQGRSAVLYSARGPEDPRIGQAAEMWRRRGGAAGGAGIAIGEQLGLIARGVIEGQAGDAGSRVRRVVLAGGDTSGHCARHLGVEALTTLASTAPGSPLCRASARDPLIDGLEVLFKGGQVGGERFFQQVATGNFTN